MIRRISDFDGFGMNEQRYINPQAFSVYLDKLNTFLSNAENMKDDLFNPISIKSIKSIEISLFGVMYSILIKLENSRNLEQDRDTLTSGLTDAGFRVANGDRFSVRVMVN